MTIGSQRSVNRGVDQKKCFLLFVFVAPSPQQQWLNEVDTANNPTVQLVGAIIYLKEGLVKDALKTIRHGTTLEQ